MKNSSKFSISRRKFIAATAGGIAVSSIGGFSPALAGGYDKAFRWISPSYTQICTSLRLRQGSQGHALRVGIGHIQSS